MERFYPSVLYKSGTQCDPTGDVNFLNRLSDPGELYCNSTADLFSCWPATKAGEVIEVQCPEHAITDRNANASKLCMANGTWSTSNYSACMTNITDHGLAGNLQIFPQAYMIYDIGYSLTIVALVIALIIFLHFKSLRCLRNIIHCNLMFAVLITNVLWLVMQAASESLASFSLMFCRIVVTVLTYFHNATFFWMFVEGLYLFTIVICAYSVHKIRLWHYIIIGWGVPLLFVLAWAGVKSQQKNDFLCWLPSDDNRLVDYIIHIPALTVLGINVIFITVIIWTLVTKLRASNTLETRQYRKALKAIAVLLPLLGVAYIILIIPPSSHQTVELVHNVINVFLQSFQGLFVAVFYCFLNGEVQAVLRQKFSALQDSRTFSRYTMSSLFTGRRRSSCYAMTSTTCNGKGGSPKQSAMSKFSRGGDCDKDQMDTEASTAMMDNVL